MASSTLTSFHEWESRIQAWMDQSDPELVLPDTSPLDRRIVVVLTVKHRLVYEDLDEAEKREKEKERRARIKLTKSKPTDEPMEREDPARTIGPRCQLFSDLTDRVLKPAQALRDTSVEWKEFTDLCQWHGLPFLQRFIQCLRQVVVECVADTPAYHQLIGEPPVKSPMRKIPNQVYAAKNENQFYLTVDMKSANFSILKHIGAIDGNAFPSWSDFFSVFVGARSLLVSSKKLRMRVLGLLPQYHKLEALWTQFTGRVFTDILQPYFTERHLKADCAALEGDEVVFHLKLRNEREINDVLRDIRQQVNSNPQVIFTVRAYRLQLFHWKNEQLCFVRLFLDPSNDEKFDLKGVPNKEENYEQALADCRAVLGL